MKRRFTSQIFGGLILIGIGAMFLLRQLGYTDFSLGYLISNYWPVILILMGMKRLLGTGDEHQKGGSSPIGGFLSGDRSVLPWTKFGLVRYFSRGFFQNVYSNHAYWWRSLCDF